MPARPSCWEVPVGSALLAVRRLVFDSEDRPIQWLHGLYRPDRYEYEMKLSRVGDIDARVWVSSELSGAVPLNAPASR
jgi:GntR family transcriptional regulator